MARKKIKIAYMVNAATRRTSFKKRKAGLIKKMEELCILCDVKAFLIIFSPEEQEPTVWPSRDVADELVDQFMSLSDLERAKKKVDHNEYLKETQANKMELVIKHEKTNRELAAYLLVDRIQREGKTIADLTKEEAGEVIWFLQEKREVVARQRQLALYTASASASTSAPAPTSGPDFWVPPPSPEQGIHLSPVGFFDVDDESYVPSFVSAFDKLAMGTTLLPASCSGVETGTGLVDSHDRTTLDQLASELMNVSPTSEDAARSEVNELTAEMAALVENTLGNESDYSFALQDGDVGGGDRSGEGQGIVLHQLDFGGDSNSSSPDLKMQFGDLEGGEGRNDPSDGATGEGLTEGEREPLIPPYFFFP